MNTNKIPLFSKYSPIYYWNKESTKFISVNQGGTSSSKTYSILQNISRELILNNYVCTVVGEDQPNLYVGALRDFKTLMEDSKLLKQMVENPLSERGPFRFKSGSILEFKSFDSEQDAKGSRRHILFINEANGVPWDVVDQLILRTKVKVFIDYNPNARFWVHTELLADMQDTDLFISNFTHNPYIPIKSKERILSWRKKYLETGSTFWKNKWRVYGLGLTGVTEGAIFDNVEWIHHIPSLIGKMHKRGYGLDFGFKQDPTALSLIKLYRDDIFAKELIYKKGLTTGALIREMKRIGIDRTDPIFADPQNAEAIVTMRQSGFNVIPAKKGQGSIRAGIDVVSSRNLHLTYDSKNWLNEQELYLYKKVNGEWTNTPIDKHNHLWDGLRYGVTMLDGFKNGRTSGRTSHSRKYSEFNF